MRRGLQDALPGPLREWRETLRWTASWYIVYERVLPCVGLGLVASFLTDFGREVDERFFSLAAQVAPVLALASIVQWSTGFQRVEPSPALDTAEEIHRLSDILAADVRNDVALLAVVGGAALYASAYDVQTTFLAVLVVTGMVLQVVSITVVHLFALAGTRYRWAATFPGHRQPRQDHGEPLDE